MKALSTRAPWWWCILYAGKRIENRGDTFPKRYRGPVLIHASKWWSETKLRDVVEGMIESDLVDVVPRLMEGLDRALTMP